MATIKSYTDLSQSQKLAEILPLESADMSWVSIGLGKPFARTRPIKGDPEELCGCWSLAALLDVLPDRVTIDGHCWFLSLGKKRISYLGYMTYDGQLHISVESDNLIDACYEMIIKLHELKML